MQYYLSALCTILLVYSFPTTTLAQFQKGYQPLATSNNTIPETYTLDYYTASKQAIAESDQLTEEEAAKFYPQVYYLKAQIFQSGKLYLKNEVTAYVNGVLNDLLLLEPDLKDDVKLYLTKFNDPNAFTLPDGTIFLNLSLLAELENEAELAFILAHEVAHYAEKHSVKDFERLSNIEQDEENYYNEEVDIFRNLRFTRESESEADSWAVYLIHASKYDINQAIGALEKLDPDSVVGIHPGALQALFKTDDYELSDSLFTDSLRQVYEDHLKDERDDLLFSEQLDDIFLSHPDVEKRIEAVQIIARSIEDEDGQNKKPVAPETFKRASTIARFERIENLMIEGHYLNALLHTAILLEQFPDNEYLHECFVKALYWISYYKEIEAEDPLVGITDVGREDFGHLYALFRAIELSETKKLAFNCAKAKAEQFPDNETLLFYKAICAENFLGLNAAKLYYRKYLEKYINGRYVNIVNNRL